MGAAQTQLIPIQELSPGAVGAIRNQVIKGLLAQVSKELGLPEDKLVVRDITPKTDLTAYGVGTTAVSGEIWGFTDTGTAMGYVSVTGTQTMADMRYAAIFGVRDRRNACVTSGSATLAVAKTSAKPVVSLVKINVGGGDRVIWDLTGMESYPDVNVGICPSAVIIPQNTTFNISYYKMGSIEVGAMTNPVTAEICWLNLLGVVVEPRGKVISP